MKKEINKKEVRSWVKKHEKQIIFATGIGIGSALSIILLGQSRKREENNIIGASIGYKNLGDGIIIGIDQIYKNGKISNAAGIGLTYESAKGLAEDILEAIPKEV